MVHDHRTAPPDFTTCSKTASYLLVNKVVWNEHKSPGQRSSELITCMQSHSHEKTSAAEERGSNRDADTDIQLVAGCEHTKIT